MPMQLDKNGNPIYMDYDGTLEEQRMAAIQASLAQDTGYADQVMQPSVQANNYQNVQANLAAQQQQMPQNGQQAAQQAAPVAAQYRGPQTSPYEARGGSIKMAGMQQGNAQGVQTPPGTSSGTPQQATATGVGGSNASSGAAAPSGYLDPRQLDTNTLDQAQVDQVSQQAAQGDQDSASALDYLKTAGLIAAAAGAGGAYVLIRNMGGKDMPPAQGMLGGPPNQQQLSGPRAALTGPPEYTDFEDVTAKNQLNSPPQKALPSPGPKMQGRTARYNANRAQTPETIAVRGERYLPAPEPSREQKASKAAKDKAPKRQKTADIKATGQRVGKKIPDANLSGRALRAARAASRIR